MTPPMTLEQEARDLLDRAGVKEAQSMTSGDLVEIANLLAHARAVLEAGDDDIRTRMAPNDYVQASALIEELRARLLVAEREREEARAQLQKIDETCLTYCPANHASVVGDDAVDDEYSRYVVMNDDADAILDTDDPCEVIRFWAGMAGDLQESSEAHSRDWRKLAGEYADLDEKYGHALAALAKVRDMADKALREMPAQQDGGGWFYPMHDGEGNYMGEQHVQEDQVIQGLHSYMSDVLTAAQIPQETKDA